MPTISIPEELAARIVAAGEDLNRFAIAALMEKIAEKEVSPKTFGDLMAQGMDVLPQPVPTSPRAGGRAWSEIEAACYPGLPTLR